jgi:hypothetical protein
MDVMSQRMEGNGLLRRSRMRERKGMCRWPGLTRRRNLRFVKEYVVTQFWTPRAGDGVYSF